MKIKIRKKPEEETQNIASKTILDKRIKLPTNIRLGVIGIIFLFLVFSTFSANAIEEKPKVTVKTDITLSYSQNGNFDYIVYLTDNMVYDGRATLKPQDSLIAFRNIVDHIDASFTYSFSSSEPANVTGEYILTARIETDMWNKQFTLASGQFNNNFNEKFPIDYLYYENVTATINAETGVTAANPQLIIECNIYNLKVQTDENTFDPGRFNPSTTVSLNEKIIDFSDTLRNQICGVKINEEKIYSSETNQEKEQWTANAYIFIIIIIIFSLVTKGDVIKLNEIEKQVKKINKKYGEWIVEVDKPPKRPLGAEIVPIKSLEDLMKISEELGKPVIHSTPSPATNEEHTFYVFDENIQYKHILSNNEKNKKIIICPKCKNQITCERKAGQKTIITCPVCNNEGFVTFEETNIMEELKERFQK